jgi:predicted alpha/beta hydrolase family esterase
MTVEAIKAAIGQLTEPERPELADWFEQLEEDAWDAEMERDFSAGGRGQHLVEKVNQEIGQGKFTPLDKGPHSRRGPH